MIWVPRVYEFLFRRIWRLFSVKMKPMTGRCADGSAGRMATFLCAVCYLAMPCPVVRSVFHNTHMLEVERTDTTAWITMSSVIIRVPEFTQPNIHLKRSCHESDVARIMSWMTLSWWLSNCFQNTWHSVFSCSYEEVTSEIYYWLILIAVDNRWSECGHVWPWSQKISLRPWTTRKFLSDLSTSNRVRFG